MVGFCTSDRFVLHVTGPEHPERPDRIRVIHQAVRAAGLIDSPNPLDPTDTRLLLHPLGGEKLIEIPAAPIDPELLELVHTTEQIAFVRRVCQSGGGLLDQSDTPVCPDSYDVALLAAGSVLAACDAVMAGRVQSAFAAVRPPGHHAEPDRPMGFCLFDNIAVAARYLQRTVGIERVAIVDFDVHHGNGTQAAFEQDGSVLFISLHQHPRTCYPGTGFEWETGSGPGEGKILNIPLPPGTGDENYLAAMDQLVVPKLDAFKPQFVLVSAGFDGHAEDPLAHLELSEEGFGRITQRLVAAADRHCNGRLVSVLEGGYNLRALGRSVVRHLEAMRDPNAWT